MWNLQYVYFKDIQLWLLQVYHTHMEPQSLTMKGQLNIQYRHDTSAILRSLFHFGAIYVNGTKYPPEKSSSQSSSNSHSSSNFSGAHNSASGYRPIKPQNRAMVGNTPQSSTMVQPTAHDRRRYVQMPSGSQAQPNVHPSQGAAVLGQGSRPVGTAVGGWGNQAVGLTVSKDSLVAGLMARGLIIPQQPPQQQQQQQQRSPHGFAPMRLHHRPVEARSMPTVVAGVPSSASQSVSLRPILPGELVLNSQSASVICQPLSYFAWWVGFEFTICMPVCQSPAYFAWWVGFQFSICISVCLQPILPRELVWNFLSASQSVSLRPILPRELVWNFLSSSQSVSLRPVLPGELVLNSLSASQSVSLRPILPRELVWNFLSASQSVSLRPVLPGELVLNSLSASQSVSLRPVLPGDLVLNTI